MVTPAPPPEGGFDASRSFFDFGRLEPSALASYDFAQLTEADQKELFVRAVCRRVFASDQEAVCAKKFFQAMGSRRNIVPFLKIAQELIEENDEDVLLGIKYFIDEHEHTLTEPFPDKVYHILNSLYLKKMGRRRLAAIQMQRDRASAEYRAVCDQNAPVQIKQGALERLNGYENELQQIHQAYAVTANRTEWVLTMIRKSVELDFQTCGDETLQKWLLDQPKYCFFPPAGYEKFWMDLVSPVKVAKFGSLEQKQIVCSWLLSPEVWSGVNPTISADIKTSLLEVGEKDPVSFVQMMRSLPDESWRNLFSSLGPEKKSGTLSALLLIEEARRNPSKLRLILGRLITLWPNVPQLKEKVEKLLREHPPERYIENQAFSQLSEEDQRDFLHIYEPFLNRWSAEVIGVWRRRRQNPPADEKKSQI